MRLPKVLKANRPECLVLVQRRPGPPTGVGADKGTLPESEKSQVYPFADIERRRESCGAGEPHHLNAAANGLRSSARTVKRLSG